MASQEDADRDALYKAAYDEAVRALSNQRLVVDSLRSRAGLLFSAAAVTTSFLGAQALDGGGLSWPCMAALASFVGVAVLSLATLWPRRWEFSVNPSELIRGHMDADSPASIGQLHRDLSIQMHASYLENKEGVDELATLLQITSGLLAIEVTLWIVAIGWRA